MRQPSLRSLSYQLLHFCLCFSPVFRSKGLPIALTINNEMTAPRFTALCDWHCSHLSFLIWIPFVFVAMFLRVGPTI
jgi:hypothetical protein